MSRGEAARIGACAVLGAIAGWMLVPSHVSDGDAPRGPAPAVLLETRPLPLTEGAGDVAAAIGREWVSQKVTVTVPGGAKRELSREELGARVDGARLSALVAQLADSRSALRRAHAAASRGSVAPLPLAVPLPVAVDGARALRSMVALKDDVDRAPVDARLDVGGHKVLADEPGRRMDVHATLARLDAALLARAKDGSSVSTIEAVVESVPPSRTASAISDIQLGDVIGFFETKYARDLKHEARTFNLRLAASKLDGHVLMPGEVFDFNDVVGPRSEVNGYKVAPVIAQGELVDGIGGGTCQVAGTLHGAAFFAGLDIVERRPHTRPSFYIKMGMDAAVAYPAITLRLRNPFPYPVVLHETVQGGVVRAEILGPKRTRDVTFVRKVADVTPFQEKEVPDPKIPKGERVLSQRGIPGFKITRYRLLRDGAFAVRERMQDAYPPTTQIWRVGTGEPDPKFEPHDDAHPEYVADDYLAISQGPHIVVPRTGSPSPEPGGAMVESRVAGRYGTHGWTEREGFAKAPEGTTLSRARRTSAARNRTGPDGDDEPGVD
jgi:vancomycin resistance protein YoaR